MRLPNYTIIRVQDSTRGDRPQFVEVGVPMLIVDATLSESHALEAEVTDYPIESGGSFSDNIRPRPLTLSLECIVSNTPIDPIVNYRQKDTQPASYAESFLRQVFEARDVVEVVTSLRTYRDMAIESLNIDVSRDVGDALKFSAKFKQIVTVQNANVNNKRVATRGGGGGSGKKKLGGQPSVTMRSFDVVWRKGVVLTNIKSSTRSSQVFGGPLLEAIVAPLSGFGAPDVTVSKWVFKGGSPIIGDIEAVPFYSEDIIAERGLERSPLADARSGGFWYHYSRSWDEKERPLSQEEYKRFLLDRERDAKGKGNNTVWTIKEWTEANPDKRTKRIIMNTSHPDLRAALDETRGQ